MEKIFMAIVLQTAYSVDTKHVIDPETKKEWMKSCVIGGPDAYHVQRRMGRKLISVSTVRSLIRWDNECDMGISS